MVRFESTGPVTVCCAAQKYFCAACTSEMAESDLNSVRALRPRIPAASPVTSSTQEDPPASASEEERELAVVGALRAAVLASGLQFKTGDSAEDLLVSLLNQRQPLLLSRNDGTAHALQESVQPRSGAKRAARRGAEHSVVGNDITEDPYLQRLHDGRKAPLACGSVRQDINQTHPLSRIRVDKLSSVSIGDVVTYDELSVNGEKLHVMAAVVAIASQRTRNNRFNLTLQVRRLYEYHELLRILDRIAHYRQNPKMRDLDYRVLKGDCESDVVASDDAELISAREAFKAMLAQVTPYFDGFTGQHHKVKVVALSDFETYIAVESVHAVLHLTLNPAVLENVGQDEGCEWPKPEQDIRAMLNVTTVVWKSFLDTRTWTLHRINLAPASMQQLFATVARPMLWAPQAVTWGLTCGFRRYIRARLTRLSKDHGESRQAVLRVPCSFSQFAFLVMSIRSPGCAEISDDSLSVNWDPSTRTWYVRLQSPILLDNHLGRYWGSISLKDERFINVSGEVLMRYTHRKPGNMTFTMMRVEFGVTGGVSSFLQPRAEDSAEDED